ANVLTDGRIGCMVGLPHASKPAAPSLTIDRQMVNPEGGVDTFRLTRYDTHEDDRNCDQKASQDHVGIKSIAEASHDRVSSGVRHREGALAILTERCPPEKVRSFACPSGK